MNLDKVWHYKYRPKTLDDLVLNDKLKNKFLSFKSIDYMGNTLLLGRPGIGKTTLAKILVSDLFKCEYMYINASDENGIDTVRGRINDFVQTKSADGEHKAVILDEADGVSKEAQKALRNVMENNLDTVRFILTGNYAHKLTEPIRSRCQEFNLNYTIQDYAKRVFQILKYEKVEFDKKIVISKIKQFFPDFRRVLNELERLTINGKLLNDFSVDIEFIKNLWDNISSDMPIEDVRSYILDKETSFSNDYEMLVENLFNYVCKTVDLKQDIKGKVLIELGECLKTHSQVINPEINFFSTVLSIRELT